MFQDRNHTWPLKAICSNENPLADLCPQCRKPPPCRELNTWTETVGQPATALPGQAKVEAALLGQGSAPDDALLFVDGKVVVLGVVQALLDPLIQVLGSDEGLGFLL